MFIRIFIDKQPLLLFVATAMALALVPDAHSQTVLSDYESSAQATQVRDSAVWRLAFRPPMQVLQQTVMTLRNSPSTSAAARAEADGLVSQASSQPEPEARRTLWHAASLLLGRSWTPAEDMMGGLSLKGARPVVTGDSDQFAISELYPIDNGIKASYAIDLVRAEVTSSATPQRSAVVKRLDEGTLGGPMPRPLTLNLAGVPDDFYLLIAKISTDAGADTELATPISVVRDLEARHASLRKQLNAVPGHEEAKQTARYPFALAEAINAGKREVISYDFKAAMARSGEIAAALAQKRDIIRQARGLQNRAYAFPETGELVPYQLYVPSTWTPERTWPLVVALHGANLDETNMLGRAGKRMQQLAEQRGFIVVAPLGYRINSGYGSERGMEQIAGDPERRRRSEQDVLNVLDLVRAEYRVDPSRVYLTGNSMGGAGTWWIGGHHPDIWAAIAPAAYGGVTAEDVSGLAHVPILPIVGDKDELGMFDRVRTAMAVLDAGGVKPELLVVPGGTHASAYDTAMPRIFDFFSAHTR